jgi:DNA polymerase III subunit delta'
MTLHPLFGHERIRASLAKAYARDVLPHALLLHGPRGVGKQHLALWLARLTVCKIPSADGPCDQCGPCRMALALEHPDIHWYFPLPRPKGMSGDRLADALEEARHQELAEVRIQPVRASWSAEIMALYLGSVANIRHRAARRPTMADGPVFIVGQAEQLVPQEASPEAANALLKLLEEPPGDARFILTSSEPGLLLPTIRSRTVPLHVPPLSTEQVRAFLETHRDVESKEAAWAAELGQGSPGRALGFLADGDDKGPLEELRRRAYELVGAASASGAAKGFELAIGFPPARARTLVELFSFVEEWLRDLAAVASGASHLVINRDALAALEKQVAGGGVEPARIPDAFPAVERARELARGNVNPQLVVSGLLRDLRRVLRPARTIAGTAR